MGHLAGGSVAREESSRPTDSTEPGGMPIDVDAVRPHSGSRELEFESAAVKRKILIVEDEADVRSLVTFHLRRDGFEVLEAADGEQGLELIGSARPDLVVLDIMLPGMSGWDVCRLIKRNAQIAHVPVLMLTARTEPDERLKGFMLGAEDYVCKPFSVREVVLRVHALMRRIHDPARVRSQDEFTIDDLSLDFKRFRFTKAGRAVKLSPKEVRILKHLLQRKGEVVRKEELLSNVWGDDVFVELGNVEVHIRHLREKLETDPGRPRLIVTVRGVGYRFQ